MRRSLLQFIFAALLSITSCQQGAACTRALWANDKAVLVGRTMDWHKDMYTTLTVYSRGMKRVGSETANSLEWVSKYGSINATVESITTDGMNEKGLAAHLLWLSETDYGKRDDETPGLSVLSWAQYYLDNFASVDEAVRFTEANVYQLLPSRYDGNDVKLHLALEDASGDSAVIECVDGRFRVYHNKNYIITTNSPTYEKQLSNLQNYSGFGGNKPLPGTTNPADRFVRAAYFATHLPSPITERAAVLEMLSVIKNVSQPYGVASTERPRVITTVWNVISDLSHHVYYFGSSMSLNVVSARLDKFDLRAGAPVLYLKVMDDAELAGDVTDRFVSL